MVLSRRVVAPTRQRFVKALPFGSHPDAGHMAMELVQDCPSLLLICFSFICVRAGQERETPEAATGAGRGVPRLPRITLGRTTALIA